MSGFSDQVVSVGELVDRGVADIRTGPFGTQLKAADYVDAGTPVINVRNVVYGVVVTEKLEHVPDDVVRRLAHHQIQYGDVVFGRKGAIDRHAYIQHDQDGWLQGSDCIRLRFLGGEYNSRFVSFLFRTQQHKAWMLQQGSHGATMASLNQDILKRISLPVVSRGTQDRIAFVLGAFDDLIANNTRRIDILEEMARAIYREWFVEFRYPGHEGVPLVESELGPIPDGWTVVNAEEAIDFNPKLRLPKEGEKTYLSMASLVENSMVINNPEKRDGNSGTKFQNGDTLFARITPSLENGKTGYVQHLADDEIAFGSTEFIVLRSLTLSPEFVYCFARRDDFRGTAINSMVGASGRQRVQEASVRSFKLPHPPDVLIETFSARVAQMFELVKTLVTQNDRLAATRDLLLPRLVSGEIDVSHLDLDNVA